MRKVKDLLYSCVAQTTVLQVLLGGPNGIKTRSDGVAATIVEGCFPKLWPQKIQQRLLLLDHSNALQHLGEEGTPFI